MLFTIIYITVESVDVYYLSVLLVHEGLPIYRLLNV